MKEGYYFARTKADCPGHVFYLTEKGFFKADDERAYDPSELSSISQTPVDLNAISENAELLDPNDWTLKKKPAGYYWAAVWGCAGDASIFPYWTGTHFVSQGCCDKKAELKTEFLAYIASSPTDLNACQQHMIAGALWGQQKAQIKEETK